MKPSLMLVAFCLTTACLNAQYYNSGLTEFTQRSQANDDAFRAQQEAAVQQQKANDSLQNIRWQQQQQQETLQQIRNQGYSGSGGSYGAAMAGAYALMHDTREDRKDDERAKIAQDEEDRRERNQESSLDREERALAREQVILDRDIAREKVIYDKQKKAWKDEDETAARKEEQAKKIGGVIGKLLSIMPICDGAQKAQDELNSIIKSDDFKLAASSESAPQLIDLVKDKRQEISEENKRKAQDSAAPTPLQSPSPN